MKTHLVRTGFVFMPADNRDNEILCQFAEGEVVEVEIRKARNYKNHKRFFALLKLGFENQDKFDSMGWWREYVLIKSGNFESCETPTGKMYRAKSISFSRMDELEFRELYRSVSQVIIDLCGITQQQLENNLQLFT